MPNELMKNESTIAEFERNEMAPKSIGAEIVASREAQEVQVAMVAAKRFPRDEYASYQRIKNDCSRMKMAEKAMYEYPKGGGRVSGPSIHLARTLARGWGNIDSGFKVLDQTATESTVMAYCWDLETNYRETKIFTVKHIRDKRGGGQPITDTRELYELIANQASRRERSCILSVIPNDIVEFAVGQCELTLKGDGKTPLVDIVRDVVTLFQEKFGVTAEQLEAYIGCKKEAFSQQSIIRLRNVFNTLRDGSASVEQYFGNVAEAPQQPQNAPSSGAGNSTKGKAEKPKEEASKPSGSDADANKPLPVDSETGEVRLADL